MVMIHGSRLTYDISNCSMCGKICELLCIVMNGVDHGSYFTLIHGRRFCKGMVIEVSIYHRLSAGF